MAKTAFLSPFSWAAQPGAWGPSLSGTWFSFQHLLCNCSTGGLRAPLCWVLVFSTASYLQLPDFLSSPGLYNCSTPTFFLWASQIALNSTCPLTRLYPYIPRPDAPVIYTGAILTAWPGSICYAIHTNVMFFVYLTVNVKIREIIIC